jgi:hypothetical protein
MFTFLADGLLQLIFCKKVTEAVAPPPKKERIHMELSNPTTDGRISFYGYDIKKKWLIDYATTHWCWGPMDNSVLTKMSAGLKLLRMHSSIDGLQCETALKDDKTPSDAEIILGHRPGQMRLPIISIFSNEGHRSRNGLAKSR